MADPSRYLGITKIDPVQDRSLEEIIQRFNDAINIIDRHSHETGLGKKIPTQGLLINGDLDMQGFSCIDMSHISLRPLDVLEGIPNSSLYEFNGVLTYKNRNGFISLFETDDPEASGGLQELKTQSGTNATDIRNLKTQSGTNTTDIGNLKIKDTAQNILITANTEKNTQQDGKILALENADTPIEGVSMKIETEKNNRRFADTSLDNKITANKDRIDTLENAEPSGGGGGTPYNDAPITLRLKGLEEKTSPISSLPSTPLDTNDDVEIALAGENDVDLTDEVFKTTIAGTGARQTGKLVAKFGMGLNPSDYVFVRVDAEGNETILAHGSDLLKQEQAEVGPNSTTPNLTLTAEAVDTALIRYGFSISAGTTQSRYIKAGSLTPSFPSSLIAIYVDRHFLDVYIKTGEETSASVVIDGTRYDLSKDFTNLATYWGDFRFDLWRVGRGGLLPFVSGQTYQIQLIMSGVTYEAPAGAKDLIKSYGSGDTNILVNLDANVSVKVQKLDHNSKANFLLDTKPKEQVTALIETKINEIPAPVIPPSSSGSGLSGDDRIKLDQHQLIFVPKPTPFETRGFKQDSTDTNVVGNYTQADSFTAIADGNIQFIIDSNEARTHADFTISDGTSNIPHIAVETFTISGVTYFVYQFTGVSGKTYTASFNGGSRHLKSNLDIEKNRADILSLKNEQRQSTPQAAKDFHKAIVESTAVVDDKIEDKRVDSVKCFATLDDVDSVKELGPGILTLTTGLIRYTSINFQSDIINYGFSVSAGTNSDFKKGGSLTPSFPSSLITIHADNGNIFLRTKVGEETSPSIIIDGTRYNLGISQRNVNGSTAWGGFDYDTWATSPGGINFVNGQTYEIQLILSGKDYLSSVSKVKQFARANIYGPNVLEKGSTSTLKTAISEAEVDQQGFTSSPLEVEGVSSNSLAIGFLMKMRASSGQDVSLIKKSGRDILVLKRDAIYARNYQPAKVANSPSEEHTPLRFDNNTKYTYTAPQFDVGVTDIHVALPADLVGNPNAVVSDIVLNIHRSETSNGDTVNEANELLSIPLNADLSPTVAIPEFVEGNYGSNSTRVLFSHKSSATGKDIAIQVQLPFNTNRVAIDSLKVTATLDYQVTRTTAVAESTTDIPLISTEDLIVDVRLTTNQETSFACELYEDASNGLQVRTRINNIPSYVRFANWDRSKIVGTSVVIANESRVSVSILTILSFKTGTKRVFETESLPKQIETYGLGLLAFFKAVGEEFDIGTKVLKSKALTAHIGDEHNAIGSVSNTTFNLANASERNSTPKPVLFTGEIESLPEGWAYDHDTGLTTLPKGVYMVCITVGGHYTGPIPSYKNEVYTQIILGDSDGHEIHTAQFIPRTIAEKQSLAGVFVSDGKIKLLISVKVQTVSFTANVVFDKGHLHIIRLGNI